MEIRKVEVADVLRARDERAERQRMLLEKFGAPVICFTMNIAGEIKRDPRIERAFREGVRRIGNQLKRQGVRVNEEICSTEYTGCEWILSADAAAPDLKKWMRSIEEMDELGRLFDIDVIDRDGRKLSRDGDRRCLICERSARECGRSRRHSGEELYLRARSVIREHFLREEADTIARQAEQALLMEALCSPKPGLVDRENSGAHRDMDIVSFAMSASALRPYFALCARIGLEGRGELEALRLPGVCAEEEMLRATDGANTHKGAIFSLGILCCAAGMDGDIFENAARIAGPALEELRALTAEEARTGGERQYIELGLTGVRGEAAAGFPAVKGVALPTLKAALAGGCSLNDAGLRALVALMAGVTDSNIIRRRGMDAQLRLQDRCRELLKSGFDADDLRRMNEDLVRENISPGGSADLLAAAYFLYFHESEKRNS